MGWRQRAPTSEPALGAKNCAGCPWGLAGEARGATIFIGLGPVIGPAKRGGEILRTEYSPIIMVGVKQDWGRSFLDVHFRKPRSSTP